MIFAVKHPLSMDKLLYIKPLTEDILFFEEKGICVVSEFEGMGDGLYDGEEIFRP